MYSVTVISPRSGETLAIHGCDPLLNHVRARRPYSHLLTPKEPPLVARRRSPCPSPDCALLEIPVCLRKCYSARSYYSPEVIPISGLLHTELCLLYPPINTNMYYPPKPNTLHIIELGKWLAR